MLKSIVLGIENVKRYQKNFTLNVQKNTGKILCRGIHTHCLPSYNVRDFTRYHKNSVLSFPLKVLAQAEETSPTPEKVVRQGIATSSPDPLPGHEEHQSVTVLRLRDDNAVYSGRVTFTTTQPVEVQILHRNMTTTTPEGGPTIPERFGQLNILQLPGGNGQVTITNVEPRFTEGATSFAASVPFSGNAVALHNLEGNEFVATYSATADILGPATRADDIAKE